MATQTYVMFRPDIWSPRCTESFFANMQAGKFFEDFSDLVDAGGKTVIIPTIGTISVSAIDQGTGTLNDSAIADTVVRLDLNRWVGTKRVLSDFNYAQMASFYRLQEELVNSQAKSLAEFVDREILATGTNFTYHVGDTNDALGATNIESAIGQLAGVNVPLDECAFFLHPTSYWGNLAKVAKYYDASIYGKARMPNAPYTEIQGIPVYITKNVLTTVQTGGDYKTNLLAHKSALAWAMGSLPGSTVQGVQMVVKDSEHLRKNVYSQVAFGVKTRRATGGVKIWTR